jgi:hypothetical protein
MLDISFIESCSTMGSGTLFLAEFVLFCEIFRLRTYLFVVYAGVLPRDLDLESWPDKAGLAVPDGCLSGTLLRTRISFWCF